MRHPACRGHSQQRQVEETEHDSWTGAQGVRQRGEHGWLRGDGGGLIRKYRNLLVVKDEQMVNPHYGS